MFHPFKLLLFCSFQASSAKSEPKENEFWLDLYKTAARKDRVKWNSKVQRNSRKTLYEQTEEMMDVVIYSIPNTIE